jgi:hypothetical protein
LDESSGPHALISLSEQTSILWTGWISQSEIRAGSPDFAYYCHIEQQQHRCGTDQYVERFEHCRASIGLTGKRRPAVSLGSKL